MKKTVREFGGEISATLTKLQLTEDPVIKDVDIKITGYIVDVAMGILARHIGTTIEQDNDLPVEPYPEVNKEVIE